VGILPCPARFAPLFFRLLVDLLVVAHLAGIFSLRRFYCLKMAKVSIFDP
jgi:hypothetical protein